MENARSFVYHGATVVGDEALDQDAEIACRMAKVAADEVMVFAGDRSVQFHGGFGYIRESAIERMVRDARIHAVGGGATEVMLEEVAKRI